MYRSQESNEINHFLEEVSYASSMSHKSCLLFPLENKLNIPSIIKQSLVVMIVIVRNAAATREYIRIIVIGHNINIR